MPRLPDIPSPEDFGRSQLSPTRGLNVVQAAPVSRAPERLAGMVQQLAVQEADRLSDASAEDALNKLREKRLELTYAPEKGFTNLQGGAVIQRPVTDEYPAQFQKEIEGLASGLRGSAAREKFQQRANGELQSYRADVYRHVAAQTDKFYTDTFNASVEVGVKEASNGLDKVAEALARTAGAVDKEIARRGLTDANEMAVFRQRYLGAIHAAAVDGMLSRGEAQAAGAYLEINKGAMSQKQLDALAPVVKRQSDWALGESAAVEAAKLKPKEAQAYLVEKTKGNKGAYDAAHSMYTQYLQAADLADKEGRGALYVKFAAAPNRATMNALLRSKEYAALTDEAQGQVSEYLRHQVDAGEDRARTLRDRAEAKERQRFADNPEALATFAALVSNPDLGSWSPAVAASYTPVIGKDMARQLEAERLRQSTGAARFQFDKKILDDAIPGDLKKPAKRDEKDAFLGIIQRSLMDWKAANPGKLPDEAVQTKILQSANAEYVQIGPWWAGGNAKVPAYAVKPDMKAVPADFYQGAKAWAAKKGVTLSDQQILDKYLQTKK